ncbi:MAG: S-layer homology domain-containing protein [Tissierellia bacterium]|nr:S-layer homology domain-containing protein [Tissierellia bacterium]
MKKALILSIAFIMLFSQTAFADTSYSDVSKDDWYYDTVMELTEKEIFKGYKDGTFKPDAKISRGEFLALVVRIIAGEREPINDYWYSGYIKYAEDMEIIPELLYSVEIADEVISRKEMAEMCEKAIDKVLNLEMPESDIVVKAAETIADLQEVLKDRKRADFILMAYARGLLQGDDKYNFNPNDGMTRAEAATVISRMLKLKAGEKLEVNFDKLPSIIIDCTGPVEDDSLIPIPEEPVVPKSP